VDPDAPKRKRGRPRLDPSQKKPKPIKKKKFTTDGREVLRETRAYPDSLFDLSQVGYMKVQDDRVVAAANQKRQWVKNGQYQFGESIVLPSFNTHEFKEFKLPSTAPAIYIMHTLFSEFAVNTITGQVAIWPVTIYNSKEQQESKKGGEPCFAIHRGLIKVIIRRAYTSLREVVYMETVTSTFHEIACNWDVVEDLPLCVLAGTERYQSMVHRMDRGFMLLPFHWFDAIKSLFVDTSTHMLRDVGVICREQFNKIKDMHIFNKDQTETFSKFDDKFRVLWLGWERGVHVSSVVGTPELQHVESMCRARAYSGQVRMNGNGKFWKMDPLVNPDNRITYTNISFGYGVQCHIGQVHLLNTAYVLLTGKSITQVTHMKSLFFLQADKPVLTRKDTLALGIIDDTRDSNKTHSYIRRIKYRLKKEFGDNICSTFWGTKKKFCTSNEMDEQEVVV